MMKNLRKEGFVIGRYRVRQLMKQLNLVVTQRLAYKVTTQRRHSDAVADNLLNMNFNPVAPNQVWAGDVTYLKTNGTDLRLQPGNIKACSRGKNDYKSQEDFTPESKP